MERKAANAVAGKTARPCEDCRKRRARWYCAADDAFLCRSCDNIIHSANPLAQRHERVRLKTSSSSSSSSSPAKKPPGGDLLPSWHKGFTRKARSARLHRQVKSSKSDDSPEAATSLAGNTFLVPEVGADEMQEDNEAQLLYRVPIFDPIDGQFHVSGSTEATVASSSPGTEQKPSCTQTDSDHDMDPNTFDHFASFFPSDMDLEEFAADVESLLGRGFGDESFCMEGLGLQDSREPHELDLFNGRVKKEEEEDEAQGRASRLVEAHFAIPKDTFELNFDYGTPTTADEEEEKVLVTENATEESSHGGFSAKRICLRLNYEAVITAWAGQGTPWTTGNRPQINPEDCWPDCMRMNGTVMNSFGDQANLGMHASIADVGREARVSRYREKRRTRLFSKKIRYEVRKLNAEKRPRMKGRFVKRTPSSFPAATAFAY